MEAWGIIMTAFTLFGMVVQMVASGVTMDNGIKPTTTQMADESLSESVEFKKAA